MLDVETVRAWLDLAFNALEAALLIYLVWRLHRFMRSWDVEVSARFGHNHNGPRKRF